MSTKTKNFGWDKPAMSDTPGVTIPQIANNLEAIDAALTNVNSSLADIMLNVKRPPAPLVGCKGDGITDDTVSLQNIINQVQNNQILFFPSGNYLIGNISINFSNLRIVGEKRSSTIIQFNQNTDTAIFSLGAFNASTNSYYNGNAQDSLFEQLTIIGSYNAMAQNGSRLGTAIQDNGSGGVKIRDCIVKGFKYGFNGAYGSDFSHIESSVFMNNDIGVYVGAGSQQFTIQKTEFDINNEAVVIEQSNHGTIEDCYFIDSFLWDICFENNTTTRSGVSTTYSGAANDMKWNVNECWFETGAGWNTNADHQTHIITRGNNKTIKGIMVRNPICIGGTSGMGAKQGNETYSFWSVQNGTLFQLINLLYGGGRLDYAVDAPSGVYPNMIQRNTRTEDGYTSLPFYSHVSNGTIYYYGQTTPIMEAPTGGIAWQINDKTTGKQLKLTSNGDGSYTLQAYNGSSWLSRFVIHAENGRIGLGSTPNWIGFGSAMPTSGSWNKGDVIENTNPTVTGSAGSQYIISGWKRITTGSNNVLNTDWVEMHTLTGS